MPIFKLVDKSNLIFLTGKDYSKEGAMDNQMRQLKVHIITGGKGGVGKTTTSLAILSHYLNSCCSEEKVLFIDSNYSNWDAFRILTVNLDGKYSLDPVQREGESYFYILKIDDKEKEKNFFNNKLILGAVNRKYKLPQRGMISFYEEIINFIKEIIESSKQGERSYLTAQENIKTIIIDTAFHVNMLNATETKGIKEQFQALNIKLYLWFLWTISEMVATGLIPYQVNDEQHQIILNQIKQNKTAEDIQNSIKANINPNLFFYIKDKSGKKKYEIYEKISNYQFPREYYQETINFITKLEPDFKFEDQFINVFNIEAFRGLGIKKRFVMSGLSNFFNEKKSLKLDSKEFIEKIQDIGISFDKFVILATKFSNYFNEIRALAQKYINRYYDQLLGELFDMISNKQAGVYKNFFIFPTTSTPLIGFTEFGGNEIVNGPELAKKLGSFASNIDVYLKKTIEKENK